MAIVLKQDQRTGKRTIGIVKDLLTNSKFHPHGIKVRLTDGQVGRVQDVLDDETEKTERLRESRRRSVSSSHRPRFWFRCLHFNKLDFENDADF